MRAVAVVAAVWCAVAVVACLGWWRLMDAVRPRARRDISSEIPAGVATDAASRPGACSRCVGNWAGGASASPAAFSGRGGA